VVNWRHGQTFAKTGGGWGVRQLCGPTLREAGQQAGGMHFSTVSTAVRRLQPRAIQDPALRRLQARLRQLAHDDGAE